MRGGRGPWEGRVGLLSDGRGGSLLVPYRLWVAGHERFCGLRFSRSCLRILG